MNDHHWRKCSVCKKSIALESDYYVCSVASCSPKSRPVQFCGIDCWDLHNEIMNHRDAYALQKKSPQFCEKENVQQKSHDTAKTRADYSPKTMKINGNREKEMAKVEKEGEILVVVSKVKKYIREKSDLNTGSEVMIELSEIIESICDKSINNAEKSGRKTVLSRDIPKISLE